MTRMQWQRAAARERDRRQPPTALEGEQKAEHKRKLAVAKANWAARNRRQPHPPADTTIYITTGANPDGSLRVLTFANHAEAAAAGFPWAGLPSTAARTR